MFWTTVSTLVGFASLAVTPVGADPHARALGRARPRLLRRGGVHAPAVPAGRTMARRTALPERAFELRLQTPRAPGDRARRRPPRLGTGDLRRAGARRGRRIAAPVGGEQRAALSRSGAPGAGRHRERRAPRHRALGARARRDRRGGGVSRRAPLTALAELGRALRPDPGRTRRSSARPICSTTSRARARSPGRSSRKSSARGSCRWCAPTRPAAAPSAASSPPTAARPA